ncbi:transcriptional regulator, partial [Burkholderia multivorans]
MDSSQRVRAIISLVQAVDAGSFAAAARQLGVTSAAVSKNVAGLEKALGVRLMNRTTRTLKLTEEGEAFLRHARIALETLDAAIDTVSARRAEPAGRVRIS